ncbi:UDP glycosyltransferase 9-like [Impatiens glandulifera]|uniref:UDP glycosyltransferase 9-like n=1 Tax=Impatiens glandulifera TaxID=253017 RepID=UPI001FB11B93|nr:UDP glycosyltransferase 9-like [Impatiens glandulifera]
MEAEKTVYKVHVLLFPSFGHGHINPMIQLSKLLAFKGLKVTIAALLSTVNSVAEETETETDSSIKFVSIFDDCDPENGLKGPGGFKGFSTRFESMAMKNLTKLITQFQESNDPVKCLFYDANLPQALDVAKEIGIFTAAFFTQSCAAIASYYPMQYDVKLSLPAFSMPGLPEIRLPNLPSFGSSTTNHSPILIHIFKQFSNLGNADWVLFNSFDKLEEQVLKWMLNIWPVRAIGPSISSADLYKSSSSGEAKEDCIKWLDTREPASVVYVAFGSNASLSSNQMIEMANALKQCNKSFLWVVKSNEETGLPLDFINKTSQKGMVVNWCPQLKVLAHKAVGCFVTHCGWNSTLEAITFGIPMVAMPQFLDQITNAYFVEEKWGIGVQPLVDDNHVSSCNEIVRCIREVSSGEIHRNALAWKASAKEAFQENGSSNKHMDDIIRFIS